MSSRYSQSSLDEASLRLIDAIPDENDQCRPHPHSRYLCEARGTQGLREIAAEVALWPEMAENLLDGYAGTPNYLGVGNDGGELYSTDQQRAVGSCMLRRALGECPVFRGKE